MMTQQNPQMSTPAAYPSPTPYAAVPQQTAPAPVPAPMPPMPQGQVMPQAMPTPQGQVMPQPMPMPQGQAMPQPIPQAMPAPAMPRPAPAMPMPSQSAAPSAISPLITHDIELEREGGERALPKISIHAFCERNETAGVINNATRDWRMKRTNVKIFMGGLPAAVEYYHKESTPSLILIESGMRGDELFAQLEQLASVCDSGTKVVVIGAANDIKLYRRLMDQGVSDYLVPPFHPLNVIRSISDLYSDPEKPFVGRTAAFFGAKGGVGSSTIAHNIAWCLSETIGQETSLVDLDASWGTTGLDFAYDSSQGLEEALAEPDRLDEMLLDRIMIRHTPKLSILPTAGSLGHVPNMSADAYEAVVDGVRAISPMAILDLPHFWSDWTSKILTSADDVVITATPDLANLRNTKNLIDFFKAERPNDGDPILILNKIGMSKTNEISIKDFAATVGVDPAVTLAFDPDSYTEAANDGKMMTDIKNGTSHVNGFNYIAQRLKTGSYPSAEIAKVGGKSKSLLSRKPKAKSGAEGAPKKESKSLFASLLKRK